MSTHYHAAQARGFYFSTYEVQVEQLHAQFTGFDPAKIAGILGLTYDENYLNLVYMDRNYRLRLADGVLEKEILDGDASADRNEDASSGAGRDAVPAFDEDAAAAAPEGWTTYLFFNEAMSIYHHLAYTSDHPRKPAGVWIPSAELEGLSSRNNNLPDPLLDPFAEKFTGKCDLLRGACEKIGGTPLNRGDVSWQFVTFPQVSMQMIYWDADEDFPAQVQILVDRNAGDYMHRETVGCIVSDLLERIEKAAGL